MWKKQCSPSLYIYIHCTRCIFLFLPICLFLFFFLFSFDVFAPMWYSTLILLHLWLYNDNKDMLLNLTFLSYVETGLVLLLQPIKNQLFILSSVTRQQNLQTDEGIRPTLTRPLLDNQVPTGRNTWFSDHLSDGDLEDPVWHKLLCTNHMEYKYASCLHQVFETTLIFFLISI